MSELGDAYKEVQYHIREQKEERRKLSMETLDAHGIEYEVFNNGLQIRVGFWDFYPTTNLVRNIVTGQRLTGVYNFMLKIKEAQK